MPKNLAGTNEGTPNDPKLFHQALRSMTRFTIEHGEDTVSERLVDPFTKKDPERVHFLRYKALFDAIKGTEVAFVPDSKAAWGHVEPEDTMNDKPQASVEVLGEGAGIKYDEYGSICLVSLDGINQDVYEFRPNGTVELHKVYDLTSDEEHWDEPRQISDDELAELNRFLTRIEPGTPEPRPAS